MQGATVTGSNAVAVTDGGIGYEVEIIMTVLLLLRW